MYTGSDDGWLKGWDAPEFFWDRREKPSRDFGDGDLIVERYSDGIERQIRSVDGAIKEIRPDGTVKTYKRQ